MSQKLVEQASNLVSSIGNAEKELNQLTVEAQNISEGMTSANAATEELSRSIDSILDQSKRSKALIGQAASTGRQAETYSQELTEASQRIEQIVVLIQKIAAQTNLLALNATIEAARAGDAGRGFAVVANEVKALATQTAKATEDIVEQINHVQDATERTTKSIAEISQHIARAEETGSAIADTVQEQSAATHEICTSLSKACQGSQGFGGASDAIRNGAAADRDRAQNVLNLILEIHDQPAGGAPDTISSS